MRSIPLAPSVTPSASESHGPERSLPFGGFVMEPVAPNCWRACDEYALCGAANRLLAYVQRKGDEFEVTQIGSTFRWSKFATLKDALASIRASAPLDISDRSAGEFAWIR